MRANLLTAFAITSVLFIAGVAECKEECWVASWQRGRPDDNLELFYAGDGLTEEVDVEGRQCIRTRGLYVYFKVPDSFAYEIDADMTLLVEYFDDHVTPMEVQYDALTEKGRSSYQRSNGIRTSGDRQWKTTAFRLSGAWLANGENQGADFRIAMSGGNPPVYRVTLSVDSLENEIYPSVAARQQALRDLKLERELRITSGAMKEWTTRREQVKSLASALSEKSRPFVQPLLDTANQAADRLVKASALSEGFEDDGALRKHLDALRQDTALITNCTFLLEHKVATRDFVHDCGKGAFPWVYFAQPAIDNVSVILPWTLPAPSAVNIPVSLQLCRGEFEPYALGLISRRVVHDVELRPTDLRGPAGSVLPASSVDIRIVKRWYQAGHYSEVQTGRELVPELLLYDDSLLKADLIQQENKLNFQGSPKDATTLQAFDLEPLSTKFLWLTVHAPDEVAAGVYRGAVHITGKDVRDLTVPLRVEILPFDLEPNPKIASMYYNQHVAGATGAALERYRRRLANMRDHGLTDPAASGSREELTLRKEFGLNKGPLLLHGGFDIGKYMGRDKYTEAEINELKATVDKYNALAEEFGYDGAYLYAIDEASGERLAAEVPVFRMLEKLGGGAWAAVLSDFEEIAAGDLQLPNYCGFPRKELVDKVHAAGHKIIRYASPQGGTEDPWQYRYLYGIVLWELNLDGGCTWTYQVAIGNPWNDFDGKGTYRDFMMTYPGADGPIDTVQWEGYREGCDDLRYMATLEKALAAAKESNRVPGVVKDVEKWLARVRQERGFNGDNLDAVRERIIMQILALQ